MLKKVWCLCQHDLHCVVSCLAFEFVIKTWATWLVMDALKNTVKTCVQSFVSGVALRRAVWYAGEHLLLCSIAIRRRYSIIRRNPSVSPWPPERIHISSCCKHPTWPHLACRTSSSPGFGPEPVVHLWPSAAFWPYSALPVPDRRAFRLVHSVVAINL